MKSRKIRIAFFADILEENFDGVSHTLYQIIANTPKEEFDIVFITAHPPKTENFPFPVIKCPSIGLPFNKEYQLAFPRLKFSLQKELDAFNPDIVHFTTPSFLGTFALKYGRKRKIPVITTYHSHFPSYIQYYFRYIPQAYKIVFPLLRLKFWIYPECDLTLAPSFAMRQFLLEYDVEEPKIRLWRRGVDRTKFHEKFQDPNWKKNHGIEGFKTILFVSRLVKEKEIYTLAKTYELFEQREKNVKFVVVGSGPGEEKLRDKMPNALFLGKKTGSELSVLFASADLFVFPSITETFGNVVLESLSSGLPVVTAQAGGPMDIVKDGVTGYHVTPKDPEAFFDKLHFLLYNDNIRQQFRKNAIDYAETQTWANVCGELFAIYRDFAASRLTKL